LLNATIIKEKIIQLITIGILCCYVLNPFQNNFFAFFHNVSHHGFTTVLFSNETYNNKLFDLKNQERVHMHGHSHGLVHEHKTLSFVKTILDSGSSNDPYVKNKVKHKFDKHIIDSCLLNKVLISSDITKHSYWHILNKVNVPILKNIGPPPRSVFS